MSVEPMSSPALGTGFERVMPAPARSIVARFRGLLAVGYAPLDAGVVTAAFALAYWLRYLSNWSLEWPLGLGNFTLNLPVGVDNFLSFGDYYDKTVTYVVL